MIILAGALCLLEDSDFSKVSLHECASSDIKYQYLPRFYWLYKWEQWLRSTSPREDGDRTWFDRCCILHLLLSSEQYLKATFQYSVEDGNSCVVGDDKVFTGIISHVHSAFNLKEGPVQHHVRDSLPLR